MYDVETYYKNRPDTGVDGETMWRCWETYINAFKDTDTQLMVAYSLGDNACKDIFERAIDAGVGLRNDGLLHWTSSGTGASNIWADGKTPSVLELAASYGYIKTRARGMQGCLKKLSPQQEQAIIPWAAPLITTLPSLLPKIKSL